MLKDTEDHIIKRRRRLSLAYAERTLTSSASANLAATATTATAALSSSFSPPSTSLTMTTTPPITPPTPPLPPFSAAESAKILAAATTASMNALGNDATTATTQAAHTLTPNSMAASIFANAAAAAAAAAAVAAAVNNSNSSNGNTANCTMSSQMQDHYSLRWNNHQNHILRAFDALLQSKALVDVTLVCAEKSIHAHKMVLSACSPFFQRVFAENPCKHPVIVLKDFRGWVVQAIVDFMYRGEISVPQARLQTLIQAGESLQVRGLIESSVPEHTPTPAASPDDFGMLDASLLSTELERCSSFDDESPSMVTAGSKVILPSRLFSASTRRERNERKRERERERERGRERERERDLDRSELESDQEMPHDSGLCTSPMPRRKQARPRRRSGELLHELNAATTTTTAVATATPSSKPATPTPQTEAQPLALDKESTTLSIAALKTVIKTEMLDTTHTETEAAIDKNATLNNAGDEDNELRDYERDSGNGNDSHHDQNESRDKALFSSTALASNLNAEPMDISTARSDEDDNDDEHDGEDDDDDDERDYDAGNCDELNARRAQHNENAHGNEQNEDEAEDIEELIKTSNELHRKNLASLAAAANEGPEDLCTTKKDPTTINDSGSHHPITDDNETTSPPKNNNNNKKQTNNNRIVLSLKDIRHLNKPSSSSNGVGGSNATNAACNNNPLNPFANASLRDLRLDRSGSCSAEALEAQMHAAAAAAAAAGENPFQHMEHQMDLSLAAAAAAAAVSQQHSRERDHALQREQQQHQHNAYANSLLAQMGMPGMPGGPFGGPVSGVGGGPNNGPNGCAGGSQALHERLEESMNRLTKEFAPTSPMSLPNHFNPTDGPPHPPSPLPFPGMSSALALTPPHMFGLDSPLGLFPPGIDPGKLYNPLMEMSDPRGMPGDPPPFLKKKMPRPKGQHSAPRGGPPRSWTNAELTEALQHVWNKKMTTSQASRIFGIPYNSLLMYVRGKYGKSLKLEQLRKDCISGPPIELLQMGINSSGGGGSGSTSSKSSKNSNKELRDSEQRANEQRGGSGGGGGSGSGSAMDMELGMLGGPTNGPRSASSEPDLLGGPNSLFNPFPPGFYPDFPGGFPGLPLSMLNLLPPAERHPHAGVHHHLSMDEDCKSDRSKHSSMDEEFGGVGATSGVPLSLSSRGEHEQRRSADLATATANGGGMHD